MRFRTVAASLAPFLLLNALVVPAAAQHDPAAQPPPTYAPPPQPPPATQPSVVYVPVPAQPPPQQQQQIQGPAFMRYEEGQPVPPGYRIVRQTKVATGMIGVGLFGLGYGTSLYIALIATAAEARKSNKTADALFVPVVGPMLWAQKLDASTQGWFWLTALSGLQAAGVIVAIYGFSSTEARLYRNDVYVKDKSKTKVGLAPIVTPSTYGVSLGGVF